MNGITFKYLILTLLFNILSANKVKDGNFTPIVMWHGMGDSCCFSFSLGAVKQKLEELLPGVHVVSLRIGTSEVNDVENGYFLHPDKQINMACNLIQADPLLSDGFNAIGFSQGAQFLRGLLQRCPKAHIKNLISLGGQHQGVYGLPNCGSLSHSICDYIRRLLNHAAYLEWVQKALVQATYWHDPLHEQEYKNYSTFLSDINNEITINTEYVQRLQTLDNFVLVKFDNDTIVEPRETEWFGFYKPGQSSVIQNLKESPIYTEDRLGLRKLDEDSKLHFLGVIGNHLQFEWGWFQENILDSYLKN
ncbi:palmitoyl-protein thioesterase 1 [Tribolium castaneum]|uniref:Palmitoyl-protein thioesterase 1 n=1 Tax=Tribolium castaneum TaxID=7070 RepID=D6W6C0_TRICA|nr:PREDICTED: palmitoyl-protein thioesterase 1 [Tribolium castaneum]EFA11379.1 Palmitoyl-protein thioesterase 1-like Protein [Tribolium castaneum]|eukprot:XP_969590.2 PREDICTED: palmitoyl-protein thioesterase 1 [Tribolium castaneum]